MGLESVQPKLGSKAVTPRQDGRGQATADGEGEEGKRRRQDRRATETQPVLNSRGEVTGRKVNTTA